MQTMKLKISLLGFAALAITTAGIASSSPTGAEPTPAAGTSQAGTDRESIPDLPGRRLGFVTSYFYYAMYQGKDACPTGLNPIPNTQEYLSKVSAAERDRLLKQENEPLLFRLALNRGPKGENLCATPWAVKDAPLVTLSGDRNAGLDLDGWKGEGAPPPGVCAQKQYMSETGDPGVDNQLGRISACINGMREKGSLIEQFTESLRSHDWAMLFEISGIQDLKNDPDVIVDVYMAAEAMSKDGNGKVVSGASIAPRPDPEYHRRLRGSIRNGILETVPVPDMIVASPNSIFFLRPQTIFKPRFQLTFNEDGSVKGFLGGYLDLMTAMNSTDSKTVFTGFTHLQEAGLGAHCEGLYHAMMKYADGNRDPRTGACDQISMSYRIEGTPTFIVRPDQRTQTSFSQKATRR